MSKNIVMLTMGMNIGGAETHIVELACALRNKGHRVTVFSNGGDYTARLLSNQVEHISAPMNNKHPLNLIRSYRTVLRFCKKERVSVIHSHTRITNFIAYFVCKKLRIPMVTTVHGQFRLGFFQRMFSRWGDRQLAVSEDLREYVTKGYHIPDSHVRLTVNGINPNRFNVTADPALYEKFSYSSENKVIICVTRIDPDASESAFRLLEAAPIIYQTMPHARILIVGDGKQFTLLKKHADRINQQTDENFVQLAGAQIDIPAFLSLADVFVGVSRAALEAMACGLPTVMMGNAGYLGTYSEQNHQACIDTNFTCRGHAHVSPETVADTILDILKNKEKYHNYVAAGQALVKERYSVNAMAEDALASYQDAKEDLRPEDLMISGYYGTHNFGDDITLQAIIDNISQQYPLKRIIILNHTTQKLINDPRIRIIHRFDLFHILPLMKKTKLFMLGGGSLLQDVTSSRSLFFYLFMLHHAVKYGCRTMIYANGIGPITRQVHQKQVNHLLHKLDRITIRDTLSYQYLLENGFTEQEISLTADEAYNFSFTASPSPVIRATGKKVLLVNLRTCSGNSKDISVDVAAAINATCKQHDLFPVLLPVQFTQDYTLLDKVSKLLNVEHHIFNTPLDIPTIISAIAESDYILTERLHPIVFAARLNKPFACIVYDPKVAATAKRFNMQDYALNLNELSQERLSDILEQLICKSEDICHNLIPATQQLEAASKQNSIIAGQLLGD